MDVQFAFQGGGARLALLLPVVEAIMELEQRGAIKVRRVSGSSAGAIAAVLLAKKANVRLFVQALLKLRHGSELQRAFPSEESLKGIAAIGHLVELLRNRPIGNPMLFEKLLARVLEAADVDPHAPLAKNAIPCLINTTNIDTHAAALEPLTQPVVRALANSTAIPFVLNMGGPLVDGGLLYNMPIHALLENDAEQEYGEVFGVCFQENALLSPADSSLRFGARLLEATMVERTKVSRGLVGAGKLFEIPVSQSDHTISTFGLNQFFDFLEDGRAYENAKQKFISWWEQSRADDEATIGELANEDVGGPADSEAILAAYSEQLRKLAAAFAESDALTIKESVLTTIARSLEAPGREDELLFRDVIAPSDKPLFAYRARLYMTSGSVKSGELNIVDGTGAKVPHVRFSIPNVLGQHSETLVLFTPPLPPKDVRDTLYTVFYGQRGGSSRPLLDKGRDFSGTQVNQPLSADKITIRLFVPTDYELELRRGELADLIAMGMDEKVVEKMQPHFVDGQWHIVEHDPDCPPGYRPYIWTACNCKRLDFVSVIYDAKRVPNQRKRT